MINPCKIKVYVFFSCQKVVKYLSYECNTNGLCNIRQNSFMPSDSVTFNDSLHSFFTNTLHRNDASTSFLRNTKICTR